MRPFSWVVQRLEQHRWFRRTTTALSSQQAFAHIVIHNGPLWWLCPGCRALRRAPDRTSDEALARFGATDATCAVIEPDPLDGGYVATHPRYPGAAAQGETEHEARYNLAADIAERVIPGHLGECVAVVILDHGDPDRLPGGVVEPNVSELVYTLLNTSPSDDQIAQAEIARGDVRSFRDPAKAVAWLQTDEEST